MKNRIEYLMFIGAKQTYKMSNVKIFFSVGNHQDRSEDGVGF